MKYKPKKQDYQVVFKKNGASSSGTKKNFEVPALNMIDNDDELGSNGGRQIQGERFVNTVYGFFLGKRVAYPVVANYVRNTWGKYGLVKSMLNSSTRLFFLQFNSMDGLDSMLENGLCFIVNMEDDVDINTLTIKQYLSWVQDDIRPGVVKSKIGNDRVLEIADLFHFPGVTHDAVMLRVFPITLKGPALRWINKLSVKLNDLLFKCPHHDMNCQQKIHIFYTRLDIPTRRVLDSEGFIPLMTPTQALISIQVMAEHSHNCFKNFEGAHLTMEYPLEKEDKAVEQSKYMRSLEETIIKFCKNSISKQAADNEWIRKFIKNTDSNIRALKTTTKNIKEKAYQLTQTILTNTGEKIKERTTMGKEYVKELVPHNLPTQFLGKPYRTSETICAIGVPEEIKEDKGDMNESCDITVKNVERLRKILTHPIYVLPNLKPIVQPYMLLGLVYNKAKEEEHDYDIPLHEHVMQPLTPQTVQIIPPDDDYVASATNPILNKHLNEFREEFTDNTRVSKKIVSNPVNDLKELLKTCDFENFIRKLKHQLSQSSHETGSLYKEVEFEVPLTRIHVETDIQEKDKKKGKNDQTKHGMEKTKSNRSQSQSKSESQPRQSQKSTK
ncbi:hypothetical protein Tco_0449075 [Tanacetum coccineum]